MKSSRQPAVQSDAGRPPVFQTIFRRAWLLSLFLAVCVVFYFAAGGSERDFSVPFVFYGDSITPQIVAKSILDHGWWWTNPSMSAPGKYEILVYPSNTNTDAVIMWLISRAVTHPGRLINLSWIVMLALSGCTAAAGLRLVGVSRWSAWCMGLLYAFAPYALYRHINHMSLVTYLVPVVSAGALLLASGRIPESRAARLFLAGGCVLIGFNYVYYAFFAAAFLLFAGAIGFFTFRRREIATAAGAGLALIVITTVLNLAPSLYVWGREGRPAALGDKMPAESENLGLKIRHLVSPVSPHSLPPFRAWLEKEKAAAFPLENENSSTRLGVVGSFGFLALLGAVIVAGRYSGPTAGLLLAGGKLTVAGVMLGTVGGFGSIFALLISPDIRAWNRLSVFLAFFALAAAGLGCDAIIRFARKKHVVWAGVAAVTAVCVFGLWDQLHAMEALNASQRVMSAEYRDTEATVAKLEAALPGSMVLQLPFRPFPLDTGYGGLGAYGQFRPYLVSRTLRWSHPAVTNEQVRYQTRLQNMTYQELVNAAKKDGFAAILIDQYGYPDHGAAIANEMRSLFMPDAVITTGMRYIAFDLRKVNADALNRASQPLPSCGTIPAFGVDRIDAGSATGSVTVTGWAVDEASRKIPSRVDVMVGEQRFIATQGIARPDVASSLQNPAYGTAGFEATIPAGTFPPGSYRLKLRIFTADGKCFQETRTFPFSLN